jgi:hypothetical protein
VPQGHFLVVFCNIICTKSGVTITYNEELVILSVRRLTTLPLYGITFNCEGLSFDYHWNCTIIFGTRVVGIGVMEMSIADIFCHLMFTFHTGTSDCENTAIIFSRF